MSIRLHRQAVQQQDRSEPVLIPGPRNGVSVSRNGSYWVELVQDITTLKALVPAWEALAREAAEPNVFYEPFMALPALEHLSEGKQIEFVLVYGNKCCKGQKEKILCGLFPIERKVWLKGLPGAYLQLWDHVHGFLQTPLVHRECTLEVVRTFLDWLDGESGNRLMKFGLIGADGPFYQSLVTELYRRKLAVWVNQSHVRATMDNCGDANGYLESAISAKRMGEYRRQARRLAEIGPVEYRSLTDDGNIDGWLQEFLRLECSGWKGKEGTALGSKRNEQAFFEKVAKSAFQKNTLQMFAVYLNGKVIAQKCNFISGSTVFGFKIAFDEDFRRYSPGAMLELENVRNFQSQEQLAWMDSCAQPDHPMIDHIWSGRRCISSVLIGAAPGKGDFLLAIAPLARWFKQRIIALLSKCRWGQ